MPLIGFIPHIPQRTDLWCVSGGAEDVRLTITYVGTGKAATDARAATALTSTTATVVSAFFFPSAEAAVAAAEAVAVWGRINTPSLTYGSLPSLITSSASQLTAVTPFPLPQSMDLG